ncbi:hypothetical protein [Planctomyces sp. SH-PL62]|uniref:hypothetical protein n=1 Tax=Planctomyces sp. SH-PL62 TaxID=1636152 RepID=UPI00078CD899|nr:hypothetical protein [Planctomyces sp. SH-PL62]AMV37852.1 hypothetical protein VT85_10470 [Planctomyces sp. SH-PL62]
MIETLRSIDGGCAIILDAATLDLLKLGVGSRVEVSVSPDGKRLLVTPIEIEAADEEAEHRARVREASRRAIARHGAAFKKLAE